MRTNKILNSIDIFHINGVQRQYSSECLVWSNLKCGLNSTFSFRMAIDGFLQEWTIQNDEIRTDRLWEVARKEETNT